MINNLLFCFVLKYLAEIASVSYVIKNLYLDSGYDFALGCSDTIYRVKCKF